MVRQRSLAFTIVLAVSLGSLACGDDTKVDATAKVDKTPDGATATGTATIAPKLNTLSRVDFNRRAAELALPLFWRTDANNDAALDADELVVLWGIAPGAAKRAEWVDDKGAFTTRMLDTYKAMTTATDLAKLAPEEQKRQQAVIDELAQGRPTLVESDFTSGSAEDKAVVTAVLKAAELVEQIYAKQNGVFALQEKLAGMDAASRMMFFRNQGPFCEAPKTEKLAECAALADKPKRISGVYPEAMQLAKPDGAFCPILEKRKDADALLHQFHVVKLKADAKHADDPALAELEAVPYHVEYATESAQIAKLLSDAASAVVDPKESAFKAYLEAASKSFVSGDWQPADEAWSKMNAENSKWYLRIGPDEVYWEPCSRKAGFHVSFARINQDSLAWQKKLLPHQKDMENALATMAGAPYKARDTSFHLPDFIDMILNAGDSRSALGATIGQSLPNWGPVANEGRNRTVAMTNLYTDKDSEAAWQAQASSLLCKATMAKAAFDPKLGVMSTVLHEAAHNLGPAHEYKVNGKTDEQIFGGSLSSMLEELKAQTSALYLSSWLVEKGAVTQEQAEGAHIKDVTWAFGHISQGMYNAEKKPKPYSQLASIQMGALFKAGGLVWKADEMAANGTDKGCFDVDAQKWKPAVESLEKRVLHIKGAGDKKDAEKLRAEFVDADDDWSKLRLTIQERWLRAPKASFVYAVKM